MIRGDNELGSEASATEDGDEQACKGVCEGCLDS